MEEMEFPHTYEDLEKLCSENFLDIVRGNTELLPYLMIEYRDKDDKKGWAHFGEFFFQWGKLYLLKKGGQPDEKSELNVFHNVFHNYYASHHRLAWGDCNQIRLYSIRTKEECEIVKSLSYYYPEDICLFDSAAVNVALKNACFEYYMYEVCKRSLPDVMKAIERDKTSVFFDFLKYSMAYDLTWRMAVDKAEEINPDVTDKELDVLGERIVSTYIMPFEHRPFQNYETESNKPIILEILDDMEKFIAKYGWHVLDYHFKRERHSEESRLDKMTIK